MCVNVLRKSCQSTSSNISLCMKINLLHLSATPALARDEMASAEERTVCLRGGTWQFTQDVTAFIGKLKTL